jgi:NADPH:quinone reductase-like Zn-dependent oxidoreductase
VLTRPYGDLVSNVESRWEPEAVLERAAGHFDAGELRVEVGATFLLEQAAEAHNR